MDTDEHTPDFEDLLAAYDISDAAADTASVKNGCVESGGGGGTSSLSLLREAACAEMRNDTQRSMQVSTSEYGIFENGGLFDTRKPSTVSSSGDVANNISRIIMELGHAMPNSKIHRARKNLSASCSKPAPIIHLKHSFDTLTKAKKSMKHSMQRSILMRNQPNAKVDKVKVSHVNVDTAKMSPAFLQSSVKLFAQREVLDPTRLAQKDARDVRVPETVDVTSQLTINALAPYVPRFPDAGDELWAAVPSKDGFACLDCGDRFLLETSLRRHLQRCSVCIELNCVACDKQLVFHNRCALFGHVRGHHERGEPSDMCQMTVKPLPVDFLQGIRKRLTDITEDPTTSETPPPITTTAAAAAAEANDNVSKYQCPECKKHCGSLLCLREHFGSSKKFLPGMVRCERCDVVCPSTCGSTCHVRIHKREQPFVCPECGVAMEEEWSTFQRHLSSVCFHLSRTTGFKCSSCGYLCATTQEWKDHLVDSHVESYTKCGGCQMAFKSEATFLAHRKTVHEKTADVKCLVIYKCPHCEVVIQNAGGLRTHLDAHDVELEQERHFLFRCIICKTIYPNKASLLSHVKDSHPSVLKSRCSVCRATFRSADLLREHERRKHPTPDDVASPSSSSKGFEATEPQQQVKKTNDDDDDETLMINDSVELEPGSLWKEGDIVATATTSKSDGGSRQQKRKKKNVCEHCNRKFHSRHGLKIHKIRSHSNSDDVRTMCAVCHEMQADAQSMAKHGHVHLNAGLLVCTLCNNLTFSTKFALSRHLDHHISNFTYPMDCFYCGEKLMDVSAAAPHWKAEHRLFDFRCDQCDAQYLYKKSLNRHKRAIHENSDTTKYPCTLCEGMEFPKHSLLLQHLETKHGTSGGSQTKAAASVAAATTTSSSSSSTSAISVEVKPGSSSSLSSSSKMASPSKRIARSSSSSTATTSPRSSKGTKSESTGSVSEFSQQPKKAKLRVEEGRQCEKCGYKNKDRSQFVAHIRMHKTDANTYQCLECGMCFVVEPSLKRHLSFVHTVKDVEAYMQKNGSYYSDSRFGGPWNHNNANPGASAAQSSSSSAVSDRDRQQAVEKRFECEVCHNVFETELSLRTHMRTHGMAFIKIKRVSNVTVRETNKDTNSVVES